MTNLLYGVTGGIAAYKAPNVVRALKDEGFDVRVILTDGAEEFTTPMALQTVSENRVGRELFDLDYEGDIGHIELARWADAMLIAPATAHSLAKLAYGMADDLLTTVALATNAPIAVSPSMNTQMLLSEPVQQNLESLRATEQFNVIEPDSGQLACREEGAGRMPDPWVLTDYVSSLTAPFLLEGKNIVVTAGPTRETIDPVRFVSNPSSGRMGYELARRASHLGADVTLVTGPTNIEPPPSVRTIHVESAEQMAAAVFDRELDEVDVFCMAAAVCDWRPTKTFGEKQSKSQMDDRLQLERTRDILSELIDQRRNKDYDYGLIGFAAESRDLEERAKAKFEQKPVDLLVANRIGTPDGAFGDSTPSLLLVTEGKSYSLEKASKRNHAEEIWERFSEDILNS
jgi:phosphopantothenoylcysteine decarboxylase/phosphopantothenate--cysteine ligase